MQITSISPEQSARFPEYVEKWTAVGLSTEPANFEAAEKAALKAYELCNLEKPLLVLRAGSPFGASVMGAKGVCLLNELKDFLTNGENSEVWKSIKPELDAEIEACVKAETTSVVSGLVATSILEAVAKSLKTNAN